MDATRQPAQNTLQRAAADRPLPAVFGILVIVLATFVAYEPALRGGLIWDDDAYVSENPLLVVPGGFWRLWKLPPETPQYYPLVFSSFWLEERLWGLSTFGLHAVNVVLHAASALLLWSVLRRLSVPGAWLAGALFALHPVHVESVAWITERKNVLSLVFYLLSFAAYLEFYRSRRWGLYAGALALFACALLSKTVTCSLPVAILLCHWWRGDRIDRRLMLTLVPFFVIGLVFGLTTAWLEKVHVGAEGDEWELSAIERVLVAGRALWFYAYKLVWPSHLVFNYPRWTIDAGAARQYAFPAAFLVLVALLWTLRARLGRGPLAAVVFFAMTLAPALGFFDVYPFRFSFVADHFQYHASLGIIILAAAQLTPRRPSQHTAQLAIRTASVVAVVILGVLTYRQTSIYSDVETLWRRTIAANNDAWLAHFNLAGLLIGRGQDIEAEKEYHEVLRINPRSADAHWNLGNIAGRRGQHEAAMAHHRAAVAINPLDPTARYNMAKELERVGDADGAIAAYRECLQHDSTFWAAHVNLGLLLMARQRPVDAWAHFQEVLRYQPDNAPALHNSGMILEREGKFAQALEFYLRAITVDGALASAWYRASVCWRKIGGLPEAEEALLKTLELKPDHVDALADVAALRYEQGNVEEAVRGYQQVLQLNPHDAQSRHNLSAALEGQRRFKDAVAVLEEGLTVQPRELALMHDLARLLATCPAPEVCDGPRAVQLATEVVRRLNPARPEALATLAAAHATNGEPDQARSALDQAIELARSEGLQDLVTRLQTQRQQYNKSKPGL